MEASLAVMKRSNHTARKRVVAGVRQISQFIPPHVAERIPAFSGWVDFFGRRLGNLLDQALGQAAHEAMPPKPDRWVEQVSRGQTTVHVLHRFSKAQMRSCVDGFIREVRRCMRRHANFDRFEDEEVVASWVTKAPVTLPSALPGIGAEAQGGYLMHMASNARQRAHVHGIRREDGSYEEGSGGRFLVGIIGARRSTIRHTRGVIHVPRGALITIHFHQLDDGPTVHQFLNEEEGGDVGNVLFSFHRKDFPDAGVPLAGGAAMMNARTFLPTSRALASLPGHGFVPVN